MSLPYHRGQINNKNNNNMSYRGNNQWGTKNQIADEANRNLLEEENDRRWSDLGEQVNILKSMTIDINSEVKNQNKMLDGMGGTFGSATDLFKNTINKLGIMVTSGSSKHMYYLVAFVVFVFLILYFSMGRK